MPNPYRDRGPLGMERKRKTHAVAWRHSDRPLKWWSECHRALNEDYGGAEIPSTRPTCLRCRKALKARKGK